MRAGKSILIWTAILLLLIILSDVIDGYSQSTRYPEILFSEFLDKVDAGQVRSVEIRGQLIKGDMQSMSEGGFSTFNPGYDGLVDNLRNQGVEILAGPAESSMSLLLNILISWFPMLLIIGVWIYVMRQMQGGGRGGGAMGFGRSRARLLDQKEGKVLFKDVAGVEEAKEDLVEVVDFLKSPEKFSELGGKIPRGCLLVGPPGTGKTLLARAVAGEADVPFFTISGSDFVEMFVGVGASRVRDLFEQGKKNAPCLIFIDEIDAVGRHRGAGLGGGNDEREQTLNQLLVEMDGFTSNEGIIIIAATNRPDVLDPALLRPGRFDRQVVVGLPDIKGREEILNVHIEKVPLAPDVDVKVIARGTPGFTGADLANLINEAALLSARRNKKVVTMSELEDAKDKVMMGAERKSMVMDEDEKKLTAYHEAGHAIVAIHCPASDPIHKATIIPRGRALGMVMRLPEKDRLSLTREKAKADMAVAMGGRVAEEMIFGHEKVTSGASSDIKYATNLAKSMVVEWGMSDKLGPVFHGSDQEEVFLGKSFSQGSSVSDDTANLIDSEIKLFVEEGYQRARKLLEDHRDQLEILAQALLEYETLTGEDIDNILKGKKINKGNDNNNQDSGNAPVKVSTLPTSSKADKVKKPRRRPSIKPVGKPNPEGV